MNWGKWIVVAFVFFALFIGTLVVISMRQDVNLVAADYYQQELAYQERIERINNTNTLATKPAVEISNGNLLIVHFPEMKVVEGRVYLFRPSDPQLDQQFEFHSASDSIHQFQLKSIEKGMYKVKLEWRMDEKDYFLEEIISM